VNTTAPTVPEPSTLATVGLGLAASITLARKRRKL
jgi:PEP-CTERM motif